MSTSRYQKSRCSTIPRVPEFTMKVAYRDTRNYIASGACSGRRPLSPVLPRLRERLCSVLLLQRPVHCSPSAVGPHAATTQRRPRPPHTTPARNARPLCCAPTFAVRRTSAPTLLLQTETPEPVLQPRGVDRPAPPAVWSRHRGLTGSGEFVDFSRTEVQLAPAPSRRVGTTGMPTGTSPAHVLQRLPTPLPPSGHSSA